MANISVHNEINFSLEDEEFETLNKAWNILADINNDMIDADVSDVNELFCKVECAAWGLEDIIRFSGRSIVKF